MKERRSVLIEGSNGLGKTISALSAVLPIAVEKKLKILYVARTHRQHERVIEELKAIGKRSPSQASLCVDATRCAYTASRNQHYDAKSLMEVCELMKAREHAPTTRTRTSKATITCSLQQLISREATQPSRSCASAKNGTSAPTNSSKSALSDVNVVALSYLYVFDPDIRTAFLKNLDTQLQKIILIVDEAHNLPETAVDVSSSSLSLFMMQPSRIGSKRFGYEDAETFARLLYEETEKRAANVRKEEQITMSSSKWSGTKLGS